LKIFLFQILIKIYVNKKEMSLLKVIQK
jgi:hypothetical protein